MASGDGPPVRAHEPAELSGAIWEHAGDIRGERVGLMKSTSESLGGFRVV
jgi:hypothetical protein